MGTMTGNKSWEETVLAEIRVCRMYKARSGAIESLRKTEPLGDWHLTDSVILENQLQLARSISKVC